MYSGAIHLEPEDLSHDMHAMEKINRLNDTALQKISSQSGMYIEPLVPENLVLLCFSFNFCSFSFY